MMKNDCHKYDSKVVPIIKCTCIVFIDNFRNISTDSSIQTSVCRGYVKHKEMIIPDIPLEFPRGRKNAVSISVAFCLDFLIRRQNITSKGYKTKNRLK